MYRLIVLACLSPAVWSFVHIGGLHPMPDGRIVGGSATTIEEYPWQISMKYSDSHRCGGALIKADYALSAAHCVDGVSANSLKIQAGVTDRTAKGQEVAVSKIYAHEKYNSRITDFDLAVLKLSVAFSLGPQVSVIALPEFNENVDVGVFAFITGWGLTSEGSNSIPKNLQVVQAPIVDQKLCNSFYAAYGGVTDNMICAGYTSGGKDACQGDSGGPMVVNNKLVGVVSWGVGCARPNYPGVYARVSTLRTWVDGKLSL